MQTSYAEKLLPGHFFPKLGLYVANCAHLERQIWLTIVKIEGLNAERDATEILEIRKHLRTKEILKRLKKSADSVSGSLRQRVIDLASHMQRFVNNRHLAIHGEWFAKDDHYCVEDFKNIGDRKNPNWKARISTVTDDEIDEVIVDFSRLICELHDVCKEIDSTR